MAGAAAFVIAALFLAGCNLGVGYDTEEAAPSRTLVSVTDDLSIEGTWKYEYSYTSGGTVWSGYEQYVITGTTLSYTYWDETNEDDYGLSFSGDISALNYNEGNASGVIIVQYTSPPEGDTPDYYNAVYFNELTANTVFLANAVDLNNNSASSEVEELEDAEDNFTWANASNYVDWNAVQEQGRVEE
jgi:hypothetical protein